MCMYVCVCVYIYIHTHTHTHKRTHSHGNARYLLSRRPSLFACPPAHLVAAWRALEAMGLNARQRHALVKTNPGLLALAPDCYARFRAALVGPRSGLEVCIGLLLCRAAAR